jgi:type 1 fimbriae regulatory protein FimB/type 1 fimbriae regulatory protein FimE
MRNSRLKLVVPGDENGTVQRPSRPNRIANDKLRGREHLTEAEVSRLEKEATKSNRHGFRDATMIMTAFRHGLRAAELCDLRWDQVNLNAGKIHVRRVKNSAPSTHILDGKEIRALRRLQREQQPGSLFVFTSERGSPFTTAGFRKMLARLGETTKIGFPIHPHMLRHATGFKLANDGVDTRAIQDYLGHKSIANTVRYSRLSPERFKTFRWKD